MLWTGEDACRSIGIRIRVAAERGQECPRHTSLLPLITFLILRLRDGVHFDITSKSRTSEEVSEQSAESSRVLAASNSVSLHLTPYLGFAFGDKVP